MQSYTLLLIYFPKDDLGWILWVYICSQYKWFTTKIQSLMSGTLSILTRLILVFRVAACALTKDQDYKSTNSPEVVNEWGGGGGGGLVPTPRPPQPIIYLQKHSVDFNKQVVVARAGS